MGERSQPRFWKTDTYNKMAPFYDLFMKIFVPIGERGRERVVDKLRSGSILDVACGTGTLLAMANTKGLTCYGIDLSDGMLAQAIRKAPGTEMSEASFYKIPYRDESFDYVIATNALSADFIDAEEVLKEMIRVCKSGGSIFIAEWPKAEKNTFLERFVVWLAGLADDAPKDYIGIFTRLGYKPTVDILSKRYHIVGITK